MEVWKYGSMQVWKYASMEVCKYASMQVCKYASMQVCKYASMQVCKYPYMALRGMGSKILEKHLKKKEEVYSENVYDAAVDDIEKALVEIHVDA